MTEPGVGRLRVLIVEDEWIIAETLSDCVRQAGWEVAGPVPSVREALAIIEQEAIAMAVLDVSLGNGQKSFPIAKALAERDIPFLFMTGYQISDLPAEYSSQVVLSKPVADETLKPHLRQMANRTVP